MSTYHSLIEHLSIDLTNIPPYPVYHGINYLSTTIQPCTNTAINNDLNDLLRSAKNDWNKYNIFPK